MTAHLADALWKIFYWNVFSASLVDKIINILCKQSNLVAMSSESEADGWSYIGEIGSREAISPLGQGLLGEKKVFWSVKREFLRFSWHD